jgi:hypothetical protein
VDIEGIGGMACFDWCTGRPIPPGTPINLTHIFLSNFTSAVVGGVGYDPNSDIGLISSSFFDDAGGLNASVMGFGEGRTGQRHRGLRERHVRRRDHHADADA